MLRWLRYAPEKRSKIQYGSRNSLGRLVFPSEYRRSLRCVSAGVLLLEQFRTDSPQQKNNGRTHEPDESSSNKECGGDSKNDGQCNANHSTPSPPHNCQDHCQYHQQHQPIQMEGGEDRFAVVVIRGRVRGRMLLHLKPYFPEHEDRMDESPGPDGSTGAIGYYGSVFNIEHVGDVTTPVGSSEPLVAAELTLPACLAVY